MDRKKQAAGLLKVWLNECGIECERTDSAVVALSREGNKVPLKVDPTKLMSTDLDVSLGAFHKITEMLGHGKPMPVNRGKAARKRIPDDTILSRWRHHEMRTVPNQSNERLKELSFIAEREARIFISRNRHLCAEMGYDLPIAMNDALVWTNTFLGRYSLENEVENRKLLTNHLRQRFKEQREGMVRERRNVVPNGAYFSYTEGFNAADPDPEWKEAHNELGTEKVAPRRAKAKELLASSFQAIGHDGMIASLKEVSASHPCEETKRTAARYLQNHIKSCEECSKKN